jgi:hypothetical protein
LTRRYKPSSAGDKPRLASIAVAASVAAAATTLSIRSLLGRRDFIESSWEAHPFLHPGSVGYGS